MVSAGHLRHAHVGYTYPVHERGAQSYNPAPLRIVMDAILHEALVIRMVSCTRSWYVVCCHHVANRLEVSCCLIAPCSSARSCSDFFSHSLRRKHDQYDEDPTCHPAGGWPCVPRYSTHGLGSKGGQRYVLVVT